MAHASLALLMTSSLGCALYVDRWSNNVTNDARFQTEYRAGDVYRLKADAQLIRSYGVDGDPLTLRSSSNMDAFVNEHPRNVNSYDLIAVVPAGSVVRVERLVYCYTVMFPPWPGDPTMLYARGTVDSAGRTWKNVVMPTQRGQWYFAKGTDVMVWKKDDALLEPLAHGKEFAGP